MNEAIELDRPIRSAMGWVSLTVAMGILILAHGCHGPDEDHELLVRQARESVPKIGGVPSPGGVRWLDWGLGQVAFVPCIRMPLMARTNAARAFVKVLKEHLPRDGP